MADKHLLLKHGLTVPPADALINGELGVVYQEGEENLYVRNRLGQIVPIGGKQEVGVGTEDSFDKGFILVDESVNYDGTIYTKDQVDDLISGVTDSINAVKNEKHVVVSNGVQPSVTDKNYIWIDESVDSSAVIYTKDEVDGIVNNINQNIINISETINLTGYTSVEDFNEFKEESSNHVIIGGSQPKDVEGNFIWIDESATDPHLVYTTEEVDSRIQTVDNVKIGSESSNVSGSILLDTTSNPSVEVYAKEEVDNKFAKLIDELKKHNINITL